MTNEIMISILLFLVFFLSFTLVNMKIEIKHNKEMAEIDRKFIKQIINVIEKNRSNIIPFSDVDDK